MRIGIRGHDFGRHTPERLAEVLAEAGVEAVQLALPKIIEGVDGYDDVDAPLLDRIRDALARKDIEISVLGCYIEPALPDDAGRARQLDTFYQGIACASALGAVCIGTETTNYAGDEAGRLRAFDLLSDSVEKMLRRAGEHGVTVAVEPVSWHTMNSPELTARLLSRFEGSGLSVIFDPSNLFARTSAAAQSALWRECLDAFGEKIVAVHVKDGVLGPDGVRPCLLGDGEIDYAGVIAPWLRAHKPSVPLLREEISPETAARDLAWMRGMFAGA